MKSLKTIALAALLLLWNEGRSQITDLGKCHPDSLSEEGFEAMKKSIGNARIVIIGEQVHGVGTDYENFAYLVKFLHEKMGFNVLAQEYCFYTFGTFNDHNEKQRSAQEYRKAMYWPQAKAIENDILFDYIDSQNKSDSPIYLEGFDPRIMQRKSFYAYCDSLINYDMPFVLDESKKEKYFKTLNNVLTYEYKDSLSNLSDQFSFIEDTDTIIGRLSKGSSDKRLIQNFKSLKGFVQNAWNMKGYDMKDVDRFTYREEWMAKNIFWIAETMYPNEKVIIRLHNGHAAKNMDVLKGSITDSLVKNSLNVGSRLYERYGDSCFYIATTYYSGTYCKWDYKPLVIPKPAPNSLETELHEEGYKYAFVDLDENRTYQMFFNEFNSWIENREIIAPFGKLFDGVIFIDQVSLPNEKDPSKE